MELNNFLQTLVSSSASELHLEPNQNPYLLSVNGQQSLSNAPISGGEISMMVFPVIPVEVKKELPNKMEVNFSLASPLGNFNVLIRKSPSGFNVVIKNNSLDSVSNPNLTVQQTVSAPNLPIQPNSQPTSPLNTSPFTQSSSPIIMPENPPFPPKTENPPLELPTRIAVDRPFEQSYPPFSPSSNFLTQEPQNPPSSPLNPPVTQNFSAPPPTIPQPTQPIVKIAQESSQSTPIFNEEPPVFPPKPENFNYFEPLETTPVVEYKIPVSPAPEPMINQTTYQPPTQTFNSAPPFEPAKVNSSAQKRMDDLFYKMADFGASDLHLSVSMPPLVRKDGKIQELPCNETVLDMNLMRELLTSIMPPKNQEEFATRHDTDFAYEIKGLARFRANIFMDRKGMGGVFRIIPSKILTAEDLKLSKHILDLCNLSKGLVVVTGPTGSGKSTTLCAMIDYVNRTRHDHLITIEDPIEFVHDNKLCLVNQREVHNHTDSFKDALRAALREDPDILLVGEMRDLETISIAIETAETGHLVFGTLHTTTAASTVDRIIDQFPADRQQQIRVMLSESLKGVIAQTLLPKKGGGRVAALEVLIVTPAISNLIREGKTFQIPSSMQTGKQHGMVVLNDALINLVLQGIVEPRDAYLKAVDKAGFELLLTRNNIRL